ncbi:hypothetical protein [Microbacterium hydrocarbonoxydans]|uniref:hypothetical protein n=1 Tax=Microbacterium hydrocarbonoxydans TaxID=273678 RepID=UPI0013DB5315|nr:hypothetical protein [Microbacterium hydrocarbonoxydans]
MNSEQNTPQPDPNAETQRFDTTPAPSDAAPGPAPAGEPVAPAASVDEQAAKKRRRRNILIGAAAAVALVAVGGGAYAVGANVGDDDDDRPGISGEGAPGPHDDDHDDRDDRDDDRRGDEDRRGEAPGGQAAGPAPASDAASLRDAAEAALAAADGTGVTSIDVEDAGYEVEVLLGDGQEVDVFVTADGTATPEPGQDDPRSDPALDLAQLDAIIEAAFAAAEAEGVSGGAIDSVSSRGDQGVAYEVSIRFDRGGDADIDLASDLTLVSADIDD